MTTRVDDLVRRQAAILHEIENLDSAEQESLANTVVRGDDKARKLLRRLIRTGKVTTRNDLNILLSAVKEGVIPALPGLFLIDLMPLPNGTFDRTRILKTPVVAWKVDRYEYVSPLIPGLPIGGRWAVLTPDGFVITDEFTNIFNDPPIALKDWIKSEIEWAEDLRNQGYDFWTPSQRLLWYSGPLARAVWRMMATRREWAGPAEEMLFLLSRFRDNATDWPTGPAALVAALTELEPVFAEAGLFVNRSDDGRLLVSRLAESGTGLVSPPSQ